jgi:arylsulfatase
MPLRRCSDNTIVVYTTDNGAEVFTWPDGGGGATPFKGEKATNWEGAFRVPCLIRWPGVLKPGTILNDLCAHEDFISDFRSRSGRTRLGREGEERPHDEWQSLQSLSRRHEPVAVF